LILLASFQLSSAYTTTTKITSPTKTTTTRPPITTEVLNCSQFEPHNIKLVTFDVFAALSLLEESLTRNIAKLLPQLTPPQVNQVVNEWILVYENNLGHNFTLAVNGPQPFRWMLNSSLPSILHDVGVTNIDTQTYNALVNCWGDLIPRDDAKSTLIKLSQAGFKVGPLSNGDTPTLTQAFVVYKPEVTPSYMLSSDFPVMCFKDCAGIYLHMLEVTGYSPLEVIHVAGSMYDGVGARNAGLFSAVLDGDGHGDDDNVSRQYQSRYQRDSNINSNDVQPCFILQHLSDIIPILVQ